MVELLALSEYQRMAEVHALLIIFLGSGSKVIHKSIGWIVLEKSWRLMPEKLEGVYHILWLALGSNKGDKFLIITESCVSRKRIFVLEGFQKKTTSGGFWLIYKMLQG